MVDLAQNAPIATSDVEVGKRQLDEYGYTIHEDLLSPAELAAVLERLNEQAALEREQGVATFREKTGGLKVGTPPVDAPFQSVTALPNKGRPFIDLALNATLLEYGRHIMRDVPFRLAAATGLFVGKGGAGGQVIHSDQQPIPFHTPTSVYHTAIVCLSDFEEEMGATRFVPGSHNRPAPAIRSDANTYGGSANEETIRTVPAVAKAGSAIVFEGRVWHGQGASTSDRVRIGALLGYCAHFMNPQDLYVASMRDDVYDSLTDEEREMFGFKVVSEYTGRLYPRSPGDNRLNTNFKQPFIPELRRSSSARAEPRD